MFFVRIENKIICFWKLLTFHNNIKIIKTIRSLSWNSQNHLFCPYLKTSLDRLIQFQFPESISFITIYSFEKGNEYFILSTNLFLFDFKGFFKMHREQEAYLLPNENREVVLYDQFGGDNSNLKFKIKFTLSFDIYILYARHYNPRFVFFLPPFYI